MFQKLSALPKSTDAGFKSHLLGRVHEATVGIVIQERKLITTTRQYRTQDISGWLFSGLDASNVSCMKLRNVPPHLHGGIEAFGSRQKTGQAPHPPPEETEVA
jgi:hypothetical protein